MDEPAGKTAPLDSNSLARKVAQMIRREGAWQKAVSLDLETKVLDKGDFLTGERILGFGVARRQGGGIERKMITLKDDSDDAEIELLDEAGRWMAKVQPIALLGYNICGYDFPLLNLKLKWYEARLRAKTGEERVTFPREYWALKDALTRSYVLDMMHVLRFAIADYDKAPAKYKSLEAVVNHPMYAHLPLMRRKGMAAADSSEGKGRRIYGMWNEKSPDFESYLEGDVNDVLLLAEEMFKENV